MKILVQKFGGTSVASQEARIAVKDKVQKAVRSGFAPVELFLRWDAKENLTLPIP